MKTAAGRHCAPHTSVFSLSFTHTEVIPLRNKGNLNQYQNYRTISPIGLPCEIMLQVILNRLEPKTVELPAEEQAGLDQAGAQ